MKLVTVKISLKRVPSILLPFLVLDAKIGKTKQEGRMIEVWQEIRDTNVNKYKNIKVLMKLEKYDKSFIMKSLVKGSCWSWSF